MKTLALLLFVSTLFNSDAQSDKDIIIDNYIRNIGGKENWATIKSFKIEMIGRSGSRQAKVEHYMLKPHNYKIVFNFPGMKRTLSCGTDGKILENDAVRTMPEDMQIEMREEADFYDELIFYKEKGYVLNQLKDTIVNQRDYWKFALIKSEKDTQFYYINKSNYLLEIIEEYSEEKKHKGILFKSIFSSYQKIDNILFPMQLNLYKNNELWIEYDLEKVHLNYKLTKTDFIIDENSLNKKMEFLKVLIGRWQGRGTLMGNEANFSMLWENVLEKKFLKLTFKNQFKDRNGIERVMSANGYYDLSNNTGYWFDSRGMILLLNLKLNDNSLTVLWGDESTEKGKTIYTLIKDQINVEDFIFRNGNHIPFGKANYKKIVE